MIVEIIGIVASVLVVISFFLNGETYIRAVNMIGSVVFVIYGSLLGSISVIFLNSMSIIINTIKIYKLLKGETLK